jgi:uncharacterized protein DUF2877
MVLNIVKSISIGSTAAKRISKSGIIGRIQSIFDRSFLIITEDKKIIFIVKGDLSNGPINIMIDLAPHKNISSLGIEVGNIVTRQNNKLLVGHSMVVLLEDTKKWEPKQLLEVDNLTRLNQKINIIKMVTARCGRHGGLGQLIKFEREIVATNTTHVGPLNRIPNKALPYLNLLITGIFEKNLVIVKNSTEHLIGLGLGLTPSADDTICGIMAVLYILGKNSLIDMKYVSAVNEAIISNMDGMSTTLVSKEFLEHAARGEVTEHVNNVINVVLSSSEGLLISKVEKLLDMGETSGTDITLGIILGLRVGLGLLARNVLKAPGKVRRDV